MRTVLDWFDWSDLIVAAAFILFMVVKQWISARWKKKAKQFITAIYQAWEDEKLTKEEWDRIIDEFMDLWRR